MGSILLEIRHVNDEHCAGHQTPCEGCDDYCEMREKEPELYEAYGIERCCGDHNVCQTTMWVASITRRMIGSTKDWTFTYEGFGQSPAEAIADLEHKLMMEEVSYAATHLICTKVGYDD